ncbi:hypothetical protein ACHRV6_21425 [Flavobacterium sp. FlaQc-51]|uniref:hypothetical protein n=1 Tax=Flavobacterium sp. FlaQc-51 TaxID=3374184 RepID=UPI0037564EA9
MTEAAYLNKEQSLIKQNSQQWQLEMNSKDAVDKPKMIIPGIIALVNGLLFVLPETFDALDFLMFSVDLITICVQLKAKDLSGFASELPFIALNFILLYMQYSFSKVKER